MASERVLSPDQCWAILQSAEDDFLIIIANLMTDIRSMTREQEQLVVHFLEAMVMLLYLQKPEVVKNMTKHYEVAIIIIMTFGANTDNNVAYVMSTTHITVDEVSDWLNRTYIEGNHERTMVEVDKCNAFFVMSNQEEVWFDTYYEYLRSEMIKRRHTRCSLDEAEKFFISSSGNPVDNPSEDLKELHDEYWLPSITTDMARSSVYAAMHKCNLTDDEKLSRPAEPKWMNANTAFHLLKMSHPVTVHATLPEKAARMQISRKYESHCLSLWCANQKKLRVGLVLDTFGLRQPSESKVHSWIEKQGWMENVPDAAEVVKDWKPPRTIQAATDSKYIRRMSRKQCWKGLQVTDIEGKGPRVVTTRPFACGEVICDYHGRLISREEGLEIYQNSEGEAGHLFFFTDKNGQLMCLDAHEEHCECHPDKTTFGRQIKHSVKRANLSPRLYSVEDEPVILFMTARTIQRGEEIRYDYGDNKRSYAGDGLDLMPS